MDISLDKFRIPNEISITFILNNKTISLSLIEGLTIMMMMKMEITVSDPD